MKGGRQATDKLAWTKRLTVLAFAILALGLAGNQWGWTQDILAAQGDKQKKQAPRLIDNPDVTRGDCDFLKSPKDFTGVQARHRAAISSLTEAVADRLVDNGGQQNVAAQDIPRANVIDTIVFDTLINAGVESAALSSDEEFLRRVYLDLTGHIPTLDQATQFLRDQDGNKRNLLIDKLISSPEFIDKWTLFYGDLFKNTAFATNINRYIGGREAFHQYIRASIAANKSYAQIATELITANGNSFENGPANFIVGGNVPMGPVQDTYDGLAVVTATTFLGLSSMDCLLCHDGAGHLDAVNLWGAGVTRAQAWGLAAYFARTRRAQVTLSQTPFYARYDVSEAATGEYQLNTTSGNRQTRAPLNGRNTVDPRYFNGAGVSGGENRRQALARHITADPQFARAAVNYIWEELMVEALVSPSNTFDLARLDPHAQMPEGWTLQPANASLLEALAREFSNNNFNLRHIIGTIAKSSAYQLSSQYWAEWKPEYVPLYARKYVRRLDAEEMHDAIVRATGLPPTTSFRDPAVNPNANITIFGFPVLDDAGNKIREVQWANQLSDTGEPRQNGASAGFLNTFLRGNRDLNARSSDSSILQALGLMNNAFVMGRIHQGNQITNVPTTGAPAIPSTVRRLLADTRLTNDELIIYLYLHTLSRYPTHAERGKLATYFTTLGRTQAAESLQWVLLNKADFMFNH